MKLSVTEKKDHKVLFLYQRLCTQKGFILVRPPASCLVLRLQQVEADYLLITESTPKRVIIISLQNALRKTVMNFDPAKSTGQDFEFGFRHSVPSFLHFFFPFSLIHSATNSVYSLLFTIPSGTQELSY